MLEFFAAILFIFIVLFIFVPLLFIYTGAVLMKLFDWFVVPLGFPQLNLGYFMGFVLITRLLFYYGNDIKNENKKDVFELILIDLFIPLVALLFGYIIKTFFIG